MESSSEDTGSDVERLRLLVALSGHSANGLSKIAGLSPAHIGMVLRGSIKKGVTVGVARALAKATGCAAGWLLTGDGAPPTKEAVLAHMGGNGAARLVHADGVCGDDASAVGPVVVRDGYDQTGTG